MSDNLPIIEEPVSPKNTEQVELFLSSQNEQQDSSDTIQLLPDSTYGDYVNETNSADIIITEPESKNSPLNEPNESEEQSGLVIEIDEIEEEDIDRMFDEQDEEQEEESSEESVVEVEEMQMESSPIPTPHVLNSMSRSPSPARVFDSKIHLHVNGMEKVLKLLGIPSNQMGSLKDLSTSNNTFRQFIQKLNTFLYPDNESNESLGSLKAKIESLKAEKVVFEAEMEQKAHQFESQHLNLSREFTQLESELVKVNEQNSEFNLKLKQQSVKLEQKESEAKGFKDVLATQKQLMQQLESEKRELFTMNVKKQEELALQTCKTFFISYFLNSFSSNGNSSTSNQFSSSRIKHG